MALNNNNPWAADVARIQAAIQQQQALIAKFEGQLAADPGNIDIQQSIDSVRNYLAGLQQQLNIFLIEYNAVEAQPTVSSGAIVSNAATARNEDANSNLPPQPGQILTPAGRIILAGSGPDGVGQISGTNATETPTQQNNPTVGTNAATKPISQTQSTTYNNNGTLTQAQLATLQQKPGSGSTSQNPVAPSGGPGAGAGAGADAGGRAPVTQKEPRYQARNQSYVYQAISVVSSFKQGRFEQTLHGQLFTQSTANTTETNAQQRVDPTTIEGYGVNEMGRTKTQQARPATTQQIVSQLPMKQQAAIAAGTDPNTVNDQGMAFGGGGL